MNLFTQGFGKTAAAASAAKGIVDTVGKTLRSAKDVGGGAVEGLKKSMGTTVGKALSLKELGHIPAAAKQNGGFSNAFKSQKGRKAMGEAVGKAAPSIAAGGAYAYGAKKLYDKTLGSSDNGQTQYMANYNY